MKKILTLITFLSVILCLLTACENMPDSSVSDNSGEVQPDSAVITVKAADCYDSMFYSFITEKSGSYSFEPKESENVSWDVYVFDEEFSDGFRYIPQAADPVLSGSGTVDFAEGKYVYIYCSANGFTQENPDTDAYLEITIN